VTGSRVAAEATFAGWVALPDRASVARGLAPPEGAALEAMERATRAAEQRIAAMLDRESPGPDLDAAAAVLRAAGARAVRAAVRRYAAGGRLDDQDLAELALLVGCVGVRDEAWQLAIEGAPDAAAHRELWRDVVRRACPELAAPAASLLAYVAWLGGDGLTATIAVDRALAAEPAYPMAQLMAEVLARAIPPSELARPRRRSRRAGRRAAAR
jgi:hypothetical protein